MTTFSLEDRLSAELAEIDTLGLTRRRRVLDSPCGRMATVDGREMLNFASNDYLGLAGNGEIAQAMADGALRWGAGSWFIHFQADQEDAADPNYRDEADDGAAAADLGLDGGN